MSIEHIREALPGYEPWMRVPSDLPPGGPRELWRSPRAIAWTVSNGRREAELRGHARLGDHPARPRLVETPAGAGVLAFELFEGPVDDPSKVIASWPGETCCAEGTRRELLASLDADVNVARALGRLGLRRRVLDRWLDARVAIETERGTSFGGVHPGWLRMQGERVVCLRCDRVREDGFRAVDLAGLALDPAFTLDALADVHGRGEARDAALELAAVSVWMREHVIGRDERLAAAVVRLIEPPPEPEAVRVWIDAPSFVDVSAWCEPGARVASSRARFLLAHVDGLCVGGSRLRVRTEPAIRRPRRTPLREARATRRRRLFSRWDRGIRADDEGLVGATPEALATRIARGARGVVVDGTTGIGSLAIAYAREKGVEKVIAMDLNRERLEMARHNARIYGVADRIEFVHGDIVEEAGRLNADLLVLDPPWGGRGYDRERMTLDDLGLDLASVLARFRGPVVLKLPRSFDPSTLPRSFELEALIDERGIVKMLIARRR